MSFDQEPEPRCLLYHSASDCLFEVFGGPAEEYLSNLGVEDVTGEECYEKRFRDTQK
jgi:hypothetical protein